MLVRERSAFLPYGEVKPSLSVMPRLTCAWSLCCRSWTSIIWVLLVQIALHPGLMVFIRKRMAWQHGPEASGRMLSTCLVACSGPKGTEKLRVGDVFWSEICWGFCKRQSWLSKADCPLPVGLPVCLEGGRCQRGTVRQLCEGVGVCATVLNAALSQSLSN